MSVLYAVVAIAAGAALVVLGAPSWLALASGLAIALASGLAAPPIVKRLTTWSLQLGVIALGAGMDLAIVAHAGLTGALITATSLAIAIVLGLALGKRLRVPGDTPLLVSVGTAICGGSAIAAVASVIQPKEHETSVALAVVFVLNAVGLVVFPLVGHALGLSEPVFGRWAALAIHDTSSVVGAATDYGKVALEIATATKLARALWIVPVTFGVAILHRRDREPRAGLSDLRRVRWPWFILGFVAVAALVTWVPAAAANAQPVVMVGRRLLVAALYLIGLSLSRRALATVGARPLALGVALWIVIATISLPLAAFT
ncbi:MAG TPA: putative sulfate exporter family transporter [Kofleriaceae bacterium]|nr:putative sulfate exporter family transporter [Kofleriaceae bacterium]